MESNSQKLDGVRKYTDDKGEQWYCAKDVCGVLGMNYSNKLLSKAGDGNVRKINLKYGKKSHQNVNFIRQAGIDRIKGHIHKKESRNITANNCPIHPDVKVRVHSGIGDYISTFVTDDGERLRAFRDKENNMWYCAWDLTRIFGLKEERKTVTANVDKHNITKRKSPNDSHEIMYVNHKGLCELAEKSPLSTAQETLDWICDNVLPKVDKHTFKIHKSPTQETPTQKAFKEFLDNPIPMLESLIEYFHKRKRQDTIETYKTADYKNRIIELENNLEMATARIKDMEYIIHHQEEKLTEAARDRQKIEEASSYLSRIMESKDGVIMTSIAADYGMCARTMNLLLEKYGILWRAGGQWFVKSPYSDKGYTVNRVIEIPSADGTTRTKTITEWTQKGRIFIYDFLKSRGILPTRERNN